MLINGYAEHVPPDKLDVAPLKWYTPHDYVPKMDNRIRVIHDCAAIYQRHSLNDAVYGGQYVNNGLLGVLLRFSLNEHAMAADIEAIYLQVRIPSRDRNALCVLWYDNAGLLLHLRMTCHLFGGVWRGSAAVSLKKCIAISDPDLVVKDTIMRLFYVDDILQSFPSVVMMSDCIPRVRDVLAGTGFNLMKYNCTSQNVMPLESNCDIEPNESVLSTTDTKTLGVRWNIRDYTCYVSHVDSQCEVECLTKLVVLKEITGMYDPLGLISPLVFDGRLICQETVVRDKHGIITSTLLYSRTRIAPLVQYTIPRLELCAAVLAIQVDATITREISADIDIQSYFYWTDGTIVLAYLQVDSKHSHTFAGNRVARIISHSEASQWRHVLSEQNPTDLASLVHLILQAVNGSTVQIPHTAGKLTGHPVSNWSQC